MTRDDETLPCPHCGSRCRAEAWLEGIDTCWPYRRFVRTTCPSCKRSAVLIPGWESLTLGTVDGTKDPVLVPSGTIDPDDYDVNWSSSGVRINLGSRKFTARAADGDLVD